MAQFLQLVQRVRQETGTAGTGPVTITNQQGQLAQLVSWTNQAYLDICNKWADWNFLWAEGVITLTPGQSDYALPTNCRQVNEDSVYLSGGDGGLSNYPLNFLEYDDYRRDKHAFALPGVPAYFTLMPNETLRLLPAPNDSFVLDFEYWETAESLSANTSIPKFDPAYDDAIIWRAVMLWAGFNEAEAEYQKAAYNYELALSNLEARYLPSAQQMHGRSQGVDIVIRAE